jgi:hypothetical protein
MNLEQTTDALAFPYEVILLQANADGLEVDASKV